MDLRRFTNHTCGNTAEQVLGSSFAAAETSHRGTDPQPKGKKRRITFLITRSDNIGGAHIHVRDLSISLRSRGHDVSVLAGGDGVFLRELQDCGVPCRSVPNLVRPIAPASDARALLEIRAALADLKPDLVSTHSSKAGWLGRVAARSMRIPVVFTAHGWSFTDGVPNLPARVYRWAERLAAPLADSIISVSDHDQRLAVSHGIAPQQKLVRVHNGMPDVPSSLQAVSRADVPRLIMVARFARQKDHTTLFRALSQLRNLPWTLDLVGDGPQYEKVQSLATQFDLRDRTRFLGERNDVPFLLADAQLFLLISNWEGLPRSILEGMRARLPVIASDVGGVREVVEHGETGFLIPRGDHATLRDKLAAVLRDEDLRERMGANGRSRYERHFTLDRMLAETERVYDAMLRSNAERGPRAPGGANTARRSAGTSTSHTNAFDLTIARPPLPVRKSMEGESAGLLTYVLPGESEPVWKPIPQSPLERDSLPIPRPRRSAVERSVNIFLSLALLVVSLPVLLLSALAIRLTSPGPILFRQVRIGVDRRWGRADRGDDRRVQDMGGLPFTIYKFRTMYQAPDNAVWATPDDPRITPVGRVLRRYRIDELPQIFNVLKGDMNLIGPRPEQPQIFARLRQEIQSYGARQRVMPGITGLAQVHHHYDTCLDDVRIKLHHDLEYIRARSAVGDLQILARTVPTVLLRRGGW